jgi:hypothetical protein
MKGAGPLSAEGVIPAKAGIQGLTVKVAAKNASPAQAGVLSGQSADKPFFWLLITDN